jgi:hypothetical protein
MVVGDGVGDRLHEHRFTGLGLGDDQGALPLADRREEIHDAAREVVVAVARETEFFAREKRRHEFELYAVADVLRFQSVDVRHAYQREILLALFGRADRAGHRVARLQSEELDLGRGNVDVVRGVQVVVIGRAQESVAVRHHFQNAFTGDFSCKIVFGYDLLRRTRCGKWLLFFVYFLSGFFFPGDFFQLCFGCIGGCDRRCHLFLARGPTATFTLFFRCPGSHRRWRGLYCLPLLYFSGVLGGFRLGDTRATGFLGSFGGALLHFGSRSASVFREIQYFFDKVLFFHHKVGDPQCLAYFTQFSQTLAFECFKVLHICPNKVSDVLSG